MYSHVGIGPATASAHAMSFPTDAKSMNIKVTNPPTFGTFFIQVDAPFETIHYCGFEW